VAQLTLIDCLYIVLVARNEEKFRRTVGLIEEEVGDKLRERH
jgi:hypothetical protein